MEAGNAIKQAAKWMMICGAALIFCGVVFGALITLLSMSRTFTSLGQSGISDPKAVASAIGHALTSYWVGLCIGGLGIFSLCTGFIVLLLSQTGTPPPPPLPNENSNL